MTAAPVDKPEAVPLATVKALAVRELHKFPEFNGAVPTNPTPLYFPDGRLAAYEFRMVKNGKTIGYIIVSANRNLPPAILEAGFGKKTPSDMMKELAARKGVKTYRFAYFSGLNYGILAGAKVVDMKGREYRKPEKYILQTGAYAGSWDTATQYTTQAATLIDQKVLWDVPRWTESDPGGASDSLPPGANSIGQISTLANSYDYIGPNADPWDDWDGCAPIAASMIIGYYEIQYRDSWYKEAVIDILHETMLTDDGGWTSTSNIGRGIENFYNRAMYLHSEGVLYYAPHYTYTTSTVDNPSNSLLFTYVMLEIGTNRPLILTASKASGENFGWSGAFHTTTVAGYSSYSDGTKYLYIHTTYSDPYTAWILLDSISSSRTLTLVNPVKVS
ncbi:C39 family peptidase [Thermococcus thermotolerans]|uniref:C39 family peptidase n=1 Tax=Thermococcus thermotolerans TaxID=2969672 RepID=UPI0021579FAD|nr:C39 family peptidase [Thermococcus thermotolerans]